MSCAKTSFDGQLEKFKLQAETSCRIGLLNLICSANPWMGRGPSRCSYNFPTHLINLHVHKKFPQGIARGCSALLAWGNSPWSQLFWTVGDVVPWFPLLDACEPASDLTDGARDGIASDPASVKPVLFGGIRDCSQLDIAGPEVEWIDGWGAGKVEPWELTEGGARSW